jgi:hypothetical protein
MGIGWLSLWATQVSSHCNKLCDVKLVSSRSCLIDGSTHFPLCVLMRTDTPNFAKSFTFVDQRSKPPLSLGEIYL